MTKKFIRHSFIFFILIVIVSSCEEAATNELDDLSIELVGKPEGILPTNAETCSDFTEVEGEIDKAIIFFTWSAAANADNYLIEVIATGMVTSSATVNTTSTELILKKGTSYSWRITAKNDSSETQSDTFSFITPGEGTGNFAPYAADITMDFNAETSALVISWIGKDKDGDTLTYDVFVKENDEIIIDDKDLTIVALSPIIAVAGATYVVQVTSKDSFGNFAISTQTLKITD